MHLALGGVRKTANPSLPHAAAEQGCGMGIFVPKCPLFVRDSCRNAAAQMDKKEKIEVLCLK